MINILKFRTLYSFSQFSFNRLIFKVVIHKMLVRIVDREDPDLTVSSEAV